MTHEFVADFVQGAVEKGHKTIEDICSFAKKKIEENQKKIAEADLARVEIANLHAVLKNFGVNVPKPVRKISVIKENATLSDLQPKTKELAINVCNYIENKPSVRLRELMREVGDIKSDYEVNDVVKWLGMNGIISRTEDRSIVKGPNWDERPRSDS